MNSPAHRQRRLAATSQVPGRTLAFVRAFYAGQPFTVVARLRTPTTMAMLTGPRGERVPLISRPEEYTAFVAAYRVAGTPRYTFIFSQRPLQRGRTYRFVDPWSYVSPTLNLIETTIRPASGGQ